ncbi:MAG: N-6 DNA methylase [Patescibacteria group bacterium]|nr:N-6 DNA methylase [Patescibacteria group bacterium]
MQKISTKINNNTIFDIKNTASFLNISSATVRNWLKSGHLKSFDNNSKNFFHINEIQNIKSKIINGNFVKLNKRANKSEATKTFIPEEYLKNKNGLNKLNNIINFIQKNNIDLNLSLFLVSLNLLAKENLLSPITIENIRKKNFKYFNKQIGKEIKSWLIEIKKLKIKKEYSYLLNCLLPKQRDILGFIYQSLLLEGKKSQSGSYYTPSNIVDEIISDYVKKDSKVLDPCCGTGQFLLAFVDIIKDPSNIYGVDIDEIAVRIARINLLIKYKNRDFAPNIVCKNTLSEIGNYDLFSLNDEYIRDFDVVATNPPWGLHFLKQDIEILKKIYPQISSLESFSYFLKKSIDLLKDNGILSFILPKSILNVKTHKDIREIILNNTQIKKIIYFDRVFKNVFTPVIRLDLKKNIKRDNDIEICKENKKYKINQLRWKNNNDFIFDIHNSGFDAGIIDKIYNVNHTTLKGKADWALGIVTGDNSKYIINKLKDGYEKIYKGKDIEKFILKKSNNYIQFTPERFQQSAPQKKYRVKEKLVYKFISKYLVFAYDDKQKLTLNSANIVIPKISDYPIKVIAALFNSSLYQFIFQKKFSSIKVLRSHIEQLPLPFLDKKIFNEITKLVDKIIRKEANFKKLDDYIMNKFSLTKKEKDYIKKFNN